MPSGRTTAVASMSMLQADDTAEASFSGTPCAG
jgi:hypothetical protein